MNQENDTCTGGGTIFSLLYSKTAPESISSSRLFHWLKSEYLTEVRESAMQPCRFGGCNICGFLPCARGVMMPIVLSIWPVQQCMKHERLLPHRPQCLQFTSLVTWRGNSAAARRQCEISGVVAHVVSPEVPCDAATLSRGSLPRFQSRFTATHSFVHAHKRNSNFKGWWCFAGTRANTEDKQSDLGE